MKGRLGAASLPPIGATEIAFKSKMYAGYWNVKTSKVSVLI